MSQNDDRQRTKQERIERLRNRLRGPLGANPAVATATVRSVLLGLLDLLADEL